LKRKRAQIAASIKLYEGYYRMRLAVHRCFEHDVIIGVA
jgi:hypothetical protein